MLGKSQVLWRIMAGQRLKYLGALVVMLLGIAFAYTVPMVCRVTLDSAIADKPVDLPGFLRDPLEAAGGADWLRHHLVWAAVAMIVLTACSGFFGFLRGRWSAEAAEEITRRLRDRLYDQLQHLPSAWHDKANPGDLVQRCTSDVETVRMFLATQVIELGRAVCMLLTVLPLMLWLDVPMTLVSLAVVPPVVIFSFVFFVKVRSAFKKSDEAEGEMTDLLQENLTGIRVVRAFARQTFEEEKFGVKNKTYCDRTFRLIRLLAWYWSTTDLMCLAQNGLTLLCGAWWVSQGQLSVGTLYAFLAYVNMFLWPVRMMGRVLTDMGKMQVSLGRLGEILDAEREQDPDPADTVRLPEKPNGELVVKELSFKHGDKTVLDNVSFQLRKGETLAVVGPSGAGKSVLIHLLLRFYDYEKGSIQLDGCELCSVPRKQVRTAITAVLQEPFLFSRNLRENIRLGHSAASDADIETAAKAACIHESIEDLEKGYETVVGERGVMLSGGQRQRVALARALVREPAVLVLDDALSAVDTHTEELILRTLRERHGEATTIFIAHRLSTLQLADQILVLEDGRVSQLGTHDELMDQEGLYQRLWRVQNALEEDLDKELHETVGAACARAGEAGGV